MQLLEAQGMGCIGCAGNCCTYEANSMLLTPLEAVELMNYLKTHDLLTPELKNKLMETVSKYRLEHRPLSGRRSYLRKTYTCPFFGHLELGCPLPREIKPYGCLAFDSHHVELKASEHCYSEKEILERREALHPEEEKLNNKLREDYQLFWEKSPIPNALLDLWDKL
jgi:Fe-S-cluster containining protein